MQSAGRAILSGIWPAVTAHSSSWQAAGHWAEPRRQLYPTLQHLWQQINQQQSYTSIKATHHASYQQCRHNSSTAAAAPSSRNLADILKLDLLQDKSADEVEHIWMSHHESSASHVATVMSKDEHTILSARAAASPLFVLPIHKPPKGYCTLLIQWQPQQALITTVDEYKKLGSNAPPHFTMTLYRETANTHGLVLVRGDVLNPRLVSPAEGRTVMELVRAFYTDPQAHQLVYAFNHQPDKFDFKQLLRELGMTAAGGTA